MIKLRNLFKSFGPTSLENRRKQGIESAVNEMGNKKSERPKKVTKGSLG